MKKVLIEFNHGLGDAVQFTSVLRHIAKYRADWVVDVISHRGKHSCFRGLCRRSYCHGGSEKPDDHYDMRFDIGYYENYNGYKDRPNTKVTNCLEEELGILEYDHRLAYHISYKPSENDNVADAVDSPMLVEKYLNDQGILDGEFVVIHYEGNTSPEKKNLHVNHIHAAIDYAVNQWKKKVIVLDWDRRCGLHDPSNGIFVAGVDCSIWNGAGTGDAGTIACLISKAKLFIGIDSGPGHVAGATATDSIIVWRSHHPMQFYDPCSSNVLHLVPDSMTSWFDSKSPEVMNVFDRLYFKANYPLLGRDDLAKYLRCLVKIIHENSMFCMNEVSRMIPKVVNESSGSLERYMGLFLRRDFFSQDQEIINDVFVNDTYQLKHFDFEKIKVVVDAGSQIGSFARLVHQKNPKAKVFCIEASPSNCSVLIRNVGHFATIINKALISSKDTREKVLLYEDSFKSTGGGTIEPSENDFNRQSVEVDTVHLDQIYNGKIDLIKLDIEGAEYLLDANDLINCNCIVGEWHGNFKKFTEWRLREFRNVNFGDMSRHNDETPNGIFHLRKDK